MKRRHVNVSVTRPVTLEEELHALQDSVEALLLEVSRLAGRLAAFNERRARTKEAAHA